MKEMALVEDNKPQISERFGLRAKEHKAALRGGDDNLGQFNKIRYRGLVLNIGNDVEGVEHCAQVARSLVNQRMGVRHIAVLNRAFGADDDDFAAWYASRTRKDLFAFGGRESNLPALKPSVLNKLDSLHLPVTVEIPTPQLTIAECGNLLAFRQAYEAELTDIADWIFP